VKIEVLPDADAVARRAAERIAASARAAVADRRRFTAALSGGHTPWAMLRALAELPGVPWPGLELFQVDERVAPDGHPERNLTQLRASLLARAPLRPEQVHAMPVAAADLEAGAAAYARELKRLRIFPSRRRSTAGRSKSWSERRQSSTSCTWASAPTATPLRSFPVTRCSTSRTATSQSPAPIRRDGA